MLRLLTIRSPVILDGHPAACHTDEGEPVRRVFTLGPPTDRRLVAIEVSGARVRVLQKKHDGTSKQTEKMLKGEAEARAESERMVRELVSRGFVEHPASDPGPAKAKPVSKPAKPKPRPEPEAVDLASLEEDDGSPAVAGADLPRLGAAPGASATAEGAPKKKKKAGG
jgi:hypothetical protein